MIYLLIYLNQISIKKAIEEQDKDITKGVTKTKNKTQGNQFFATQKGVIKNPLNLYNKKNDIINVFINRNIYLGDVEKDVQIKCLVNYQFL